MSSACLEPQGAFALDRTTQEHLLERLSASHRASVAFTLDLPRESSAREIAKWFEGESRLQAVFDGISGAARGLIAEAMFDTGGVALSVRVDALSGPLSDRFLARESCAAATELERYGLAFAFIYGSEVDFHIPVDLRARLRRLVAARCAQGSESATAQEWLPSARLDLKDIVALWAQLVETPASLTLEGELHARSASRLIAVLSELELPDPEGAIAEQRLLLALAQLRDGGYLRLQMTDERTWKRHLIPSGDLGDALRAANPFQRFPSLVPSGDPMQRIRDEGAVNCARVLSDALDGRRIGLASLGHAMCRLGEASGTRLRETLAPEVLALSGLLPEWLRGEVQLGLTRGAPTAARFVRPDIVPSDLSELADQCDAILPAPRINDELEDENSFLLWVGSDTRQKWQPHEPAGLEKNRAHGIAMGGLGLILLSTLDTPLLSSAIEDRIFVAL